MCPAEFVFWKNVSMTRHRWRVDPLLKGVRHGEVFDMGVHGLIVCNTEPNIVLFNAIHFEIVCLPLISPASLYLRVCLR
jgi:hypothetical protein